MTWRCFHCDDVFTDAESAALHFGVDTTEQAACRKVTADEQALLKTIAEQAKQLNEYRTESTPADQLYYTFQSELRQKTIRAEELGYHRGLEDGRRDWLRILWWRLMARPPSFRPVTRG